MVALEAKEQVQVARRPGKGRGTGANSANQPRDYDRRELESARGWLREVVHRPVGIKVALEAKTGSKWHVGQAEGQEAKEEQHTKRARLLLALLELIRPLNAMRFTVKISVRRIGVLVYWCKLHTSLKTRRFLETGRL